MYLLDLSLFVVLAIWLDNDEPTKFFETRTLYITDQTLQKILNLGNEDFSFLLSAYFFHVGCLHKF